MKYILDPQVFRRQLVAKGYANVMEFARRTGIHRNTLGNFLKGRSVLAAAFQTIARSLEMDPQQLMRPVSEVVAALPQLDELRPVLADLLQHDAHLALILCGSRARKNPRTYSDWDLGLVRYPEPLSGRAFLRLRRRVEDLSESLNLVRHIDVINLDQAPRQFLENVRAEAQFLDGNPLAWIHWQGVLDGVQKN